MKRQLSLGWIEKYFGYCRYKEKTTLKRSLKVLKAKSMLMIEYQMSFMCMACVCGIIKTGEQVCTKVKK